MTIRIDAHQHFWNPHRGDYGWLTPELKALYRSYGPQDLVPLLQQAGIQGTVLVQAAPSVEETEYMLGIADTCNEVLGVVGWVDFEDPTDLHHLDRLARHPLFKGVRPMIQDLPDDAWMLKPELDWAFRAIIAHDLAFDALTLPRHLGNLRLLVERYPEMRVVIDHGSKPDIARGEYDDWAASMRVLAGETSVLVKLSGLVTEADAGWQAQDLAPYVDLMLDAFGPARLMFGSDWPVVTLACDYQRWVDAADALTTGCSPGERLAIFGGNAVDFYRLTPP